jgi:hypothetical protein
MATRAGSLKRDEKVKNLILNHSLISMGMFEDAFADLAEKMTEAMAEMGAAAVDALAMSMSPGSGRGPGIDPRKVSDAVSPQIRSQIGRLFSEIREEIASQWPTDRVFKDYIANPAFDKGVEIVEKYDFGRPKLTEDVGDNILASYLFLLQSGDKELGKMFKELAEWQTTLPTPPWRM